MKDPFSPDPAWASPPTPTTALVRTMPYGIVECRVVSVVVGGGEKHVWFEIAAGPDAGARFRAPWEALTVEARKLAKDKEK